MSLTANGQRIVVNDVHLSYGSHAVLRGLTLHVAAGEIYALLGGNGAGKSTTMSALLGFVRPDAGTVEVAGYNPATQADQARAQIAYVPENVALYDHLTARENAAYLLALAGRRPEPQAIDAAFEATGLQEAAWDSVSAAFPRACGRRSRSRSPCCAKCRCCCSTNLPRALTPRQPRTSTGWSMMSRAGARPC